MPETKAAPASAIRLDAHAAEALIAHRLTALGHAPDLLDQGAVAVLVADCDGSGRRLRTSLAATLFLASTEGASAIGAGLVHRALGTLPPVAAATPAAPALPSALPAPLASVAEPAARPVPPAPAASAAPPTPSLADAGVQRPATMPGVPDAAAASVAAQPATPAPTAGVPAAPASVAVRPAATGPTMVPASAALPAALVVPGATAVAGGDAAMQIPPRPPQVPAEDATVSPAARPARRLAMPTLLAAAAVASGLVMAAVILNPRASAPVRPPASAQPASQPAAIAGQSRAPADFPPIPPGLPAPTGHDAAPPAAVQAPAPATTEPPAAAAPDPSTGQAANTPGTPPASPQPAAPTPPAVPSASVASPAVTSPATTAARVATGPAAVVLLYPARTHGVLDRLRPVALALQRAGFADIRAKASHAAEPDHAISFFHPTDQRAAETIARILTAAHWPNLSAASLQPVLITPPADAAHHTLGTVEVQLP